MGELEAARVSPLYLPHISPISPYISPISPYISLYLPLLDEATSALDLGNEAAMYSALAKVPGITYVSVGHRPSLLRYHASRLRLYGMDQAPSYAVEPIDEAAIEQQAKEEREMADQTAW